MTDTQLGSAPGKPRRWLRALAWGGGILTVLLVLAYFVATSSGFFKGVVLPRVSKAMNARITVSDARISPFSQVVLRDVKVQTTGTEPLATVTEARLRYSLMAILGGNIRVDELTLSSPAVTVVENPDGTSNLDPLWETQTAPTTGKEPAPPAKPAQPPQIDLKKFSVRDATIRQVKSRTNGPPDVTEFSHVNVTVDDLRNGQKGKLALDGDIRVATTNGLLQGKVDGSYDFALAADLKPASIKGSARLNVSRAEKALADFAAVSGALDAEITPTEVKAVALRLQKQDTPLGELRASGPFEIEKYEGRLNIELSGIDQRLLNLLGAQYGLAFGPATIRSTHQVELTRGGSNITARGQVDVGRFQVTRTNQTTPQLDLHKDYDASIDLGQKTALVRRLNLTSTQNGSPLLKGDLTSPMPITWGDASSTVGDSTFTFSLSGLNLADWKPFLGEVAAAGLVNANAKLLSQQGGRQLTLNLDSRIDRLTANIGGNQLADATITLQASGKAADLKQFNLAALKLEVARQNQMLATASGSGTYTYGPKAEAADMQIVARAMLAPLLQALPQPDLRVSSGSIELNAHLTQEQKTQAAKGNVALAAFTGQWGQNAVRGLGAAADFDVGLTPLEVQIRKLAGKLTGDGKAGGSFDLAAKYNLEKRTVDLTAKLADLNQNGVGPFLEPLLADKKLMSVAINANATARYDPQGASALKADLQMANLVVADPKNQTPGTPLEAKMLVDASVRNQMADLRQFQLALTPTPRADNKVELSGQVDLSQTNAIRGDLKLAADALDLTSYYDLFVGDSKAAEGGKAATTSAPAPASAQKEPEAVQLRFRNFTASASIRRLYLREVEIADWQTAARIDGSRVVINPCKLTLNGAPAGATADLDLGMPGWKYDLSLSAQAVPLTPLVNSFQPERKGQIGGTATAQGKITGAGISGASLQKHLAGQFDMTLTNLNFAIVNLEGKTWYTRLLKTVVTGIMTIPELAKNPAGAVMSLLSGGARSGGATSGDRGMADLTQSRINTVVLRTAAGAGRVDLQKATVQSPAFEAQATGTITLAEVLTNSPIRMPVSVSLARPIAQRIGMAGNTPTNATYAKLPDFLIVRGTLGKSEAGVDKIALLSGVLQATGGKAGQVGELIQGSLRSLLPAGTNTSSNGSTTRSGSGVGGLLQGIGAILGQGTPAATNAPATNQSPVNDLLRGILEPKQK